MQVPNTPAIRLDGQRATPGDSTSDLFRRVEFLRDRLDENGRFAMLGKLLIAMRDGLYPRMHILSKADGSLVVTIPRPQAGDQ